MMRIKKNDTVFIRSGKDKGKKSTVIDILPAKDKVLVKDVALAVHHVKAKKQGQTSSIKNQEGYINLSKVMPVCPSCNQPCRINVKSIEDGKRARVCNHCKDIF